MSRLWRGNSGNGVLVRDVLVRDANSVLKRGSVAKPYTTLKLDRGTHRISYEFILSIKGRIVFVRPTLLSEVAITEQTRHDIKVAETTTSNSMVERSGIVRVASKQLGGEAKKR